MVDPIQYGVGPAQGLPGIESAKADAPQSSGGGFGKMLTEMIQSVEKANREADVAVQGLLTGESADVHSVMLAMHKADLSLRLALEVRNKLVEAYQEVMRMSV